MTSTTKAIQIPLIPEPGDIWFFIDLAFVEDVPQLYDILSGLGIKPLLAYRWDVKELNICLLLYHCHIPLLTSPPSDLWQHEQEILANAIDTDAIHFCCGLSHRPQAIAA